MAEEKLWCNYSDLPSVLSYEKPKHKTHMTYKAFLEVTLQLQKQDRIIDDLYKNNVDLMDFVDPYHHIVSVLIKEIYGKEGLDWWSWFCYENDFGQGKLEAWDADKNLICYSFESLWEYLEANKTTAEKA